MQIFKPSGDLKALRAAARVLKDSNQQLAIHGKAAKAAKETLFRWLKDNRGVDIETLKSGETVLIEDVLLLEVASQNKFDESAFMLAQPEEHAKWKKDLPVKKFKALV